MTRLLIAAGLGLAAVLIGMLLRRSGPPPPISVRRNQLPTRVSLTELGADSVPTLVIFTESSCQSCREAEGVIRGPAGAELPVLEYEYGESAEVHKKFAIDTVPTTLVVGADGTVVAGWLGRIDLGEFASALAQVVQSDSD